MEDRLKRIKDNLERMKTVDPKAYSHWFDRLKWLDEDLDRDLTQEIRWTRFKEEEDEK